MLWYEVEIAVGLFGGLLLVLEITFQLGRLVKRHTRDDEAQLGTIQAATLGLLGLLLGFSFSGAADRFVDHQELIVQEANAIATAYYRADLLAEPYRGQLRDALKQYIRRESVYLTIRSTPRQGDTRRQSEELQDRIWQAAMTGVKESPQFNEVVLPPVNQVIDLHATRLAALDRHLPFAGPGHTFDRGRRRRGLAGLRLRPVGQAEPHAYHGPVAAGFTGPLGHDRPGLSPPGPDQGRPAGASRPA